MHYEISARTEKIEKYHNIHHNIYTSTTILNIQERVYLFTTGGKAPSRPKYSRLNRHEDSRRFN